MPSRAAVSIDFPSLEARYMDSCKRHGVVPNSTVLSWFCKAKIQKSMYKTCNMVILLDYLKDADFSPLIDVLKAVNSSDIDTVDIIHESHCILNQECLVSLLGAIKSKLRVLDLKGSSLDDFLSDPSQVGLSCQVLHIKSSKIRELNIMGRFDLLHTLNLDFCTSLISLPKDCFACVPNLMRLSMCETSVGNLWTACAALSKLRSLVELRFQKCLCCEGTGPCPVSSREISDLAFNRMRSGHLQMSSLTEHSSDLLSVLNIESNSLIEVSFSKLWTQDGDESPTSGINHNLEGTSPTLEKYVFGHPSLICFEKHYRDFVIVSLPGLAVLDNLPITKFEREKAKNICSEYYEFLPYKRQLRENVVNLLHEREAGVCRIRQKNSTRSLSAAKFGCSSWPLLHLVSNICHITKEEGKSLRPRQFEYNPLNPSLMVCGTLDGEIVVINHENGNIVGYVPSLKAMDSVLGLCWLKKYPNKFLAGSDDGSLRLYDVNHMLLNTAKGYASPPCVTFDDFEQLTSVHVNSTDDQFLTSGCSKNVALYDIGTGRCLQLLTDMHRGPINVAKFANHSPFLFVTSSFDHDVKMWDLRQKPVQACYTVSSSGGNVMVCFSPDDLHLLVSAVDNEVKQLMAVDGRLHIKFDIASTGNPQNYTRSYYMNGRDYVISGSCDEPVVRICCAQTGRRLRDVYLEAKDSGRSMFVQSLRGDPIRHFQMAVLATTSTHFISKSEIVKINLLASSDDRKDCCRGLTSSLSSTLGG